jgi:hypothetical protein
MSKVFAIAGLTVLAVVVGVFAGQTAAVIAGETVGQLVGMAATVVAALSVIHTVVSVKHAAK